MPLSRRSLLAAGAATGLAAHLPARAATPPAGRAMREAAGALLAALPDPQARAARFAFSDPLRARWNYMLGARPAPGLPLEDMDEAARAAALRLLATALSPAGFEKALNVMLQQDILRDEWGKGAPDRNRDRFSVMIFGTPAETGAWSWRWEGHHLSLSFTLLDDAVISVTPNSFSSEPNTVPSGPHRGLVVLKEEETLGRALYRDLSPEARARALVNPRSPGNVLTIDGRENRYDGDTRGLPLADMTAGQRDMALRLIEVYTAEPFAAPLAEDSRARLAASDPTATRFVWAGADLDGSIYYRLHGDAFLIEFASLRNQPLHLHTAVHDTGRNLGRHLL